MLLWRVSGALNLVAVKELINEVTIVQKPYYSLYIHIMVT